MSRPHLRRALALGAASILGVAACGDDDLGHESSTETVAPSADAIVIELDADAARSAGAGTQTMAVGSTVSLRIVSTEEHEFHVHGYDIEDSGTDLTVTFVADEAGEFEVENHDTEDMIFTFVVE